MNADYIIDLAKTFAKELIRKSGVREWEQPEVSDGIAYTAWRMAAWIVYYATGATAVATNKILNTEMDDTPKQIVFRDSTDFSPTAANDLRKGSPTLAQFDGTSLANAAYWQSTKFDFGAVRADEYQARLAVEIAATPTAGNTIDIWLAPSSSATAGTGNAGGVSGADGTYAGYSANAAAAVKQLIFLGSFVCTAQATTTVQVLEGPRFSPPERYGSLVLLNGSGAALFTDMAEFNLTFDPIIPQIQAAV